MRTLDPVNRNELMRWYECARKLTCELCEPLEIEDHVVQPVADVSPPKWHLGHTTWFFERMVLSETPGYEPLHPQYNLIFNSYYNALGPRWARSMRGALSRPTVREVLSYRSHVDQHLLEFLRSGNGQISSGVSSLVELGTHHEQQHQELLITDIKAILAHSPIYPVYRPAPDVARNGSIRAATEDFTAFPAGRYNVGFSGVGFAYDNEKPAHFVWLGDFELRNRLVTNGEFLDFINDGGYQRPELWLADGWDLVQQQGWNTPLYWIPDGDRWKMFTLSGVCEMDLGEPVCHVSYFETDAFARWKEMRLPTEHEWEVAARTAEPEEIHRGSFLDSGLLRPAPDSSEPGTISQMFGEVWQWTSSAYLPYPGFRALPGALGEYNGKFMNGQYVLRGGSCATPRTHIRASYRNFFQPEKRWQFTGIRLAR
ncbi:MAG: ergothioneine biosynthesis protein EgtB [Acidobacteria bacterium]|nr:MAG: ergothioneine biosynthesis protein EgtB [Acidobacteriota bacterium]